eukprot:3676623-Amphidinium_carterae.1
MHQCLVRLTRASGQGQLALGMKPRYHTLDTTLFDGANGKVRGSVNSEACAILDCCIKPQRAWRLHDCCLIHIFCCSPLTWPGKLVECSHGARKPAHAKVLLPARWEGGEGQLL